MSQSMVLPITIALQATAPAETTPRIEGDESGTDFSLGADPAGGLAAWPPVDSQSWTDAPSDPLQRLVEALSGISGALSERHDKSTVQKADRDLPAEVSPMPDGLPMEKAMPMPDGAVVGAGEGQPPDSRTADQDLLFPLASLQTAPIPPAATRGADAGLIPGLPQPTAPALSDIAPDRAEPAGLPKGAAPEGPGPGHAGPAGPLEKGASVGNAHLVPADPLATQPRTYTTQGPSLAGRLPAGVPATEADLVPADPVVRARTETEGSDLVESRAGLSGRAVRISRQIAEPARPDDPATATRTLEKTDLAERLPADVQARDTRLLPADALAAQGRMAAEEPGLASPPPAPTPFAGRPIVRPIPGPGPDAPVFDMSLPDRTAFSESLFADIPALDAGLSPADPLTAQTRMAEGTGLADPRSARALPVARQIAEALVITRGEVVEIALAPEELGRLRMVVSGPDQAPHVTIWVERPEVLDQLRRNGSFLQECLGDAGMGQASFEFRGDTPSDSSDQRDDPAGLAPDGRAGISATIPAPVVPLAWTPVAVSARLDIRI
ncbi:flagellar hook-length control protein FliK [Paracoccus subflavus]|uniref:Flagellar hook-length control protein FliK n=1 Tax=Paracoccus subflavus TaxID=2528244 RepID=A0A4Q9FWU4_9RHOB|nr:flagellar hook-length control protein FliK [Paracoccus subflavus]TBN36782.1 flagellar hook-length control protein FliK [Paracoccus subflavus]